jgi:aspartyl-tRNA(Asn)/glutamyl-tRNA(Gln) amidotransferase subunit A
LPLGIQLIGAPFSEALLYRVAHAYEQASPWKDLHPTLV